MWRLIKETAARAVFPTILVIGFVMPWLPDIAVYINQLGFINPCQALEWCV